MDLKRYAVLVKQEVTYGTDPTPAISADEIIFHGEPSFDCVTKPFERPVALGYFGKLPALIIGEAYKLNGKCELTPSGVAGTPPRIGRILRAANCTETISAGVSVGYTPHSTFLGDSVAIYFWAGGTKHILLGCVANVKWAKIAGEPIMLDVEFTGLYGGTIADAAFPTLVLESASPMIWTAANFKFNAVTTLICSKLDFDFGNVITARKDANATVTPGISRYYISDRAPKVSFDIEKEDLSTLNPWTLHTAQTLCDLETKPTGSAGSKIELLINDITLDAPKYGQDSNKLTWPLSGAPKVSLTTGNAAFSITFK